MSDNSLKSIRNGAMASVIAGVVMLAIPAIREYVVSFFSWLWSSIVWCWEALFTSYSIPGWTLLLISIFSLIGVITIYVAVKRELATPEFKYYVKDYIKGAIWRWSWAGNRISNLWCFCPRCEGTLVYDDSSCTVRYVDENKTDFICENCGHIVITSIKGGDRDYAIAAITREIDRRIRTGEYKKH